MTTRSAHLIHFVRFALVVIALATGARAGAQNRAPAVVEFSPGGELENYLRLLQISGSSEWYPWSLRAFSGRELEKLLPADSAALPWRLSSARIKGRFSAGPLGINSTFNSAFPYGGNDGAVWAGRGLTISATSAVAARLGPLSLTLAPLAFITTNGAFPLHDNGQSGALVYNDGLFPGNIDRPQRFGDEPYGRGDPSASEIRFDTRYVTFGFGTAPIWWGPAAEYPFLLGTNAPGFPHAFAGSGEPLNVWLGRLHARAVWGKLAQSPYTPVTGSDRYESTDETGRTSLVAGLMLIFSPGPIPNLELGLARFAHIPYPTSGISSRFLRKPIPTFFKKNVYGPEATREVDTENELASVFARWAFPSAGFELYAEHGHDDWYHDLRDLVQEPDHNKAYVVGFQKVLSKSAERLSALRGEIINHQMPSLGRDRPGQGYIYTHAQLPQGHTNRGQLLGSNAGVGAAAASVLAWDRYTPRGRTTFTWRRIVRAHTGTFYENGVPDDKATDVIHALGAERSRGSASLRYTLGVDLVTNFNRNFTSDVFNLNVRAGMQWSLGRATR